VRDCRKGKGKGCDVRDSQGQGQGMAPDFEPMSDASMVKLNWFTVGDRCNGGIQQERQPTQTCITNPHLR
jgi:hypothetical protein